MLPYNTTQHKSDNKSHAAQHDVIKYDQTTNKKIIIKKNEKRV